MKLSLIFPAMKLSKKRFKDLQKQLVLFVLVLTGCQTEKSKQEAVSLQSPPEKTLESYIKYIQAGNLGGVQSLLCPPDTTFSLDGPVPVKNFKIVKKLVLSAEDVKEQQFVPPPKIGDVQLDVMEYFEGDSAMFYYWFRKVDGVWKLYTLAGPHDC